MKRFNPDIHHRRSIRLKGYDYSQQGAYYVTICTHWSECLFGDVIDDFLNRITELSFDGHAISQGENVVFKGGHLSRRISQKHHNDLLFLAVEFRKIFMDEWEGTLYEDVLEKLIDHFSQVVNQVVEHPLLRG